MYLDALYGNKLGLNIKEIEIINQAHTEPYEFLGNQRNTSFTLIKMFTILQE